MSKLEQDILEYENEKKILELKNECYKNDFVDSILNKKLGNEIKNSLINKPKITKFKLFRHKLKNTIKRIFDML